jgi:hypothetical protein
VIGRLVDVHAGLDTVQVTLEGRTVGSHLRCWGRHAIITDPAHVATAKTLRTAYQQPRPATEERESSQDLLRDLADYDRAFGVDLNPNHDEDRHQHGVDRGNGDTDGRVA